MTDQRPPWAVRLQTEREARSWNKHEMARQLHKAIGKEYPPIKSLVRQISSWEHGDHFPRDWAAAYAGAYGMDEAELFDPAARSPASVLAELLPIGDLSATLATVAGRRGGSSTVADLSSRVHALRLADDVLGSGDLLGPAFRGLDAAVRLREESTHAEDVGRALLSVIGELAQITGWIASDAGQHERAADTYRLGIHAAREAEDRVLESNITGSLAYQTANVSDPAEGVALAEAALDVAGPDAPPRARALAWDRVAWAHARADRTDRSHAQAAMRALGEAAEALAEHGTEPDPAYLYWVEPGELQIMEARVYTELRRPLRAVPLLADVLNRYDATHTRELALYLSWLAIALADANEPEEAAAAAERMLRLSDEVASERTAQRGRLVLARLEPYEDVPAVRELLQNHR